MLKKNWKNLTFLADVLENDEKLKQRFLLLTDKPKAIVIYEDLIEPDLGYRGSVTGYREELLRLYRKTGNTEKVPEMLWDLVCKSKSHEYYNELKTNHGGLAHTL